MEYVGHRVVVGVWPVLAVALAKANVGRCRCYVAEFDWWVHQHGIHSSRRSLGGVLTPSSLVMSNVAMAVSSVWGECCRMFLMFLIHFLAPPFWLGIQMAVGNDDLKVSGKLSVDCSTPM